MSALEKQLPGTIQLKKIVGGLAPDTMTPMPEETIKMVKLSWQRIEQRVPNIHFNQDFWTKTTPIRSTYPSCRALIAAQLQSEVLGQKMLHEIQQAYYQQAENPALSETLGLCAERAGLDTKQYQQDVTSKAVESLFQQELSLSQKLGAPSFPSLFLDIEGSIWPVLIDYEDASIITEEINVLIEMALD